MIAEKEIFKIDQYPPAPNGFVYVDDVLKALELSYNSGENIILYGPGGHGKSELTEWFFKSKNIVPYVKSMGAGTTTDSLFGGIDIQKFNETGKLEYLVENSFMNHEYVVLEEALDAPEYILEQLKDILTSKKFRNGTQVFDIKTKMIVICTNRSREDFASSNTSLKALMERFPLEVEVKWDSYSYMNYEYMFKSVLSEPFTILSKLIERVNSEKEIIISPRTAVKAAKILKMNNYDYECLKFIAEFSDCYNIVKSELRYLNAVDKIKKTITEIESIKEKLFCHKTSENRNVKEEFLILKELKNKIEELNSLEVPDDNVNNYAEYLKEVKSFLLNETLEHKKLRNEKQFESVL